MLNKIKKIREQTGAGVVMVKKALEEAKGDEKEAIEILRKLGQDRALKKAERKAKEGVVVSYIHSNKKIGAMLKLFCETDFVARNEEFQELAKDIVMHIAAMDPKYARPEDVPEKIVEHEREIWKAQLAREKKPEAIMDKILSGKEKKFREEQALLTQPFVKDPEKTVGELITEKISKTGENIQLGEFVRYDI